MDEFGSSTFDPKRWINAQLRESKRAASASAGAGGGGAVAAAKTKLTEAEASDPAIRELIAKEEALTGVYARVLNQSTEVGAAMDSTCNELFTALPKVLKELSYVSSDAGALRVALSEILSETVRVEGTNGAVIQFLSDVDRVKGRMERTVNTLSEAEKWNKRIINIETVFEDRNLNKIAAELSVMRASLSVMTQLPVYGERAEKLSELQNRLEAMATPHLLDALSDEITPVAPAGTLSLPDGASPSDRSTKLASLTALFRSIDRTSAVQTHYFRSRADRVQRIVNKHVSAAAAANASAKPAAPAPTSAVAGDKKTAAGAAGAKLKADTKTERKEETDPHLVASETLPQWLPQVELLRAECEWCATVFAPAAAAAAAPAPTTAPGASSASASASASASTSGDGSASTVSVICQLMNLIVDELHVHMTKWIHHHTTNLGSETILAAVDLFVLVRSSFIVPLKSLVERAAERERASALTAALFEPIVGAALKPFFKFLGEYAAVEKKKLFRVLNDLTFGGSGYTQTCENILRACTTCFAGARAALDRCITFTGGVETESLVAALNEYLTEYVQRLFSLLRRIRKLAGLDSAPAPSAAGASAAGVASARGADLLSDTEDWSGFQGAFQLLRTARSVKAEVDRFELHASQVLGRSVSGLLTYANARTKSDAAAASASAADSKSTPIAATATAAVTADAGSLDQTITYLFLIRDATKTRGLQQFVSTYGSGKAAAATPAAAVGSTATAAKPKANATPNLVFSQPLALLESWIGALKNLIFDTLFSSLRSQLVGLAELPVWGEAPRALFGGLLSSLPSFSTPSEYMTHAGERLLSVVQELENYLHAQAASTAASAASADSNDTKSPTTTAASASDEDANEWAAVLASGVVKFVLDRISHIPRLSDKGAGQLATDIDYLANVLKAVGVPIPVVTEHVIRALQTPPPATNWTAALLSGPNWTPACTDPDHRSLVLTLFAIRKTSHVPAPNAASSGGGKLNG